MNKEITENVKNFLTPLPKDKTDHSVKKNMKILRNLYGDTYVESLIWTQEDARQVLCILGIDQGAPFYNFYLNSIEEANCYRSENIYGLSEVLEGFRNPFWGEKYPDIEKKYLQISSIEGEYSYFYNKQDDSVYGVDWCDMNDFTNDKLVPLYASFNDFLEWYYSDEDEY